jgi:hypothetical protein
LFLNLPPGSLELRQSREVRVARPSPTQQSTFLVPTTPSDRTCP